VQSRLDPEHKLAAEFLRGQRLWQRHAVLVEQFNPFFRCLAQFSVNPGFVGAMHAALKQAGAAANEALVFVAPFNKLRVTCRLFLDLLACHGLSLFHRLCSPPHIPLLVMLGVVAWAAAQRHPHASRVCEIPMAALAAAIHKPRPFQVGNQLANLARHFSIKLVSRPFTAVNRGQG